MLVLRERNWYYDDNPARESLFVLKEPNFTRRNDGKDPLPAVSRSYAIIRRKELFKRAVGKSC